MRLKSNIYSIECKSNNHLQTPTVTLTSPESTELAVCEVSYALQTAFFVT